MFTHLSYHTRTGIDNVQVNISISTSNISPIVGQTGGNGFAVSGFGYISPYVQVR